MIQSQSERGIRLGRVEHLAGAAADGVDDDVDSPEGIDRLADHPVGVVLDGRVGRDRDALRPGGPDALDGGVARLLVPARDRDLRPGAGERLADRGPDGAAAARDEGDLPLEAEDVELCHGVPSRWSASLIDYRGKWWGLSWTDGASVGCARADGGEPVPSDPRRQRGPCRRWVRRASAAEFRNRATSGISRPDPPSASPVADPRIAGAVTCRGPDLTFPVTALSRLPIDELAGNAPAAGLRSFLGTEAAGELGLPGNGWRVVAAAADRVSFVAEGPSGWVFATVTVDDAGVWSFWEGGACDLAVALPDTFAFASWRLDPARPLDPGSTEVAVLALELACASGAPPWDRLQPPIVIESADAVTIAIVTLKARNADCPGNPEFPVVVDLSAPLGGRALFDGSAYPLERR